MNSSDNKIHEIHEFSTGIQFEQRGNSWIWTGFTIKYMNSTIGEEIPKVVERSIANEEFALAEGSSTEKPAIIARILGSGDDIWSVVAVVTRGRDEVGRSAAFHRYFLCQGDHKLRVILAWWEQNNRPTFNPLDQQDEGSPHIFGGEIPQPPDLEQILPLFKVQTKPQEEQRLLSSSQSAQEAVLTWGVPGQSGETRVIKEGIFPLSEEPLSTPELQNVEEYSLFQQLSPIVLEPNVQYDLYTINVLAISKRNSCKNGLPVCWAFDVEALVKPERFQVIKPASQKARDGINRAIAAGSRVVRNAVNIDEAALKSALRSLANSSQVRQEAVETIINGLNNKDVTREYWHSLFNAQGTDRAIKEKIYSPQIVRLMTLRALVIPETLPEFLQWLNIQKGSNVDGNQRVSLELQKKIQPLFPEEQIGAGITYLLPSLLGGKISVDGLCRLLAKSGGDTIWAYGRNQFINNIKYDLQLIYNYYSKPIVGLFDESTLKCGAEAWRSLINRWQDIQRMYKKCEKYRPLAQLFERFKEYDLAGYFYQVTDGFVKKDLFYEIAEAQNRPSPVIYGLGIKKELTLEDIIIGLADGVVKFFNQEEFRKDLGLIESKSLAKKEVLTVKQSEPQKKEPIKAEKSVESEVIPSRYTKLETLLKAQNFREADEETRSVMLAVANRQSEGYLRLEDAENFPCKELRTIDNLWLKYSQGKFGISVQQEIYKNLGGTKFYDSDIWESFGERVGWRKQGSWLYYSDLNFSLSAPTGHLPAAGGGTLIEEEAFARFTLISRKKCLGGARGRGRGRWGVVL